MNKQELIKKYGKKYSGVSMSFGAAVLLAEIQKDLKQLDEPQKVQVPHFVADWIFKAQLVDRRSIRSALEVATIRLYAKNSDKVIDWLKNISNQDTFAIAWANDYEAEKEKRYLVKLKNINDYLNTTETGFHFYNKWRNNETFTRKELEEANFGWVFDCEGIEIEEAE